MENRDVKRNNDGVTANQQAIEFLQTIDFKALGRTVFKDHLATVSETGKSIGELTISVEETIRGGEVCYYVHAQSHGVLDEVPMGTSVTAYISRGVVTLEQTQHEYIKIPNKPLDKKTVLIKEDNKYVIKRTTTEGMVVSEKERTYPLAAMKGFISEGANIILQRILCLRQEVPEQAKFIAIDSTVNLTHQTYEKLPDTVLSVGGKTLQVLGLQRQQISNHEPVTTWHTHFLPNGNVASRVTLGSYVRMQLLELPKIEDEIQEKKIGEVKKDLHWKEDMQMHSHFLERKEELIDDHKTYFRHKPELRALLEDFCQFVLLRKPDDVCTFASDYFRSFSTKTNPPSLPVEAEIRD